MRNLFLRTKNLWRSLSDYSNTLEPKNYLVETEPSSESSTSILGFNMWLFPMYEVASMYFMIPTLIEINYK